MNGAARLCRTIGFALSVAASAFAAQAKETLEPYQMVRSLQLVQDRIAAGDHAAMPMQGKLLEMIDARFRAAKPADFKDPRNFRALLVYGMSGGNPVTVEATASRIELDAQDDAIADGVVHYLRGRPAAAIKALRPIRPLSLPADLGAFVALVEGSLLATEDPAQALTLLDQARLLSPGTLVEEAALRRSVGLAAATGDAARFALASTQYVERFLYSPYASQFADSFVSGVVALNMAISQDKLADITAMMDPERAKVIYLRIARSAAIDGFIDLSTFASAKAEGGRLAGPEDDPRALLYASLSTMTSATVAEIRDKLKKIDRSELSESDRSLLDAARTITREMIAPPAEIPAESLPPAHADDGQASQAEQAVPDETGLPPVEGAEPALPAAAAAPQSPVAAQPAAPVAKQPEIAAANAAPIQAALPAGVSGDPTDAAISDTRRKLDMIDQLLGASPK